MFRSRLIGILVLTLATVLIGYGLYAVFFKATRRATAPPTTTGAPPSGGLEPAGTGLTPSRPTGARPTASPVARGGLTLAAPITTRTVSSPALGAGGSGARFYDKSEGKFYAIGEDGVERLLADKTFPNAKNVVWSPGDDKAIIEFPDGANVLYNFRTGAQATLPKHWQDFSFSPDGGRIAGKSIGTDQENRFLMVANADGSGATAIEPLGANADKVQVAWSPRSEVIAFSRTGNPIGFGREEILFIGTQGENFKSAIVEGLGFKGQWSGDGNRVLYSVYSPASGYRPELWVTDGAGESIGANRRRIGLETWVDKCTVTDAATAYCAVPTSLSEGAAFAPEIASETADLIYRIDLATGGRTLVAEPETRSSISKIMVSRDGRALYFTEALSGALRRIQLTP